MSCFFLFAIALWTTKLAAGLVLLRHPKPSYNYTWKVSLGSSLKPTVRRMHRKVLNCYTVPVLVCCWTVSSFTELCNIEKVNVICFFFQFKKLMDLQLAYVYLLPKKQEMLRGANLLCIEIALILYISCAEDILESLSRNSTRFKPNVKKKKKMRTSEKESVTLSPLSVKQ